MGVVGAGAFLRFEPGWCMSFVTSHFEMHVHVLLHYAVSIASLIVQQCTTVCSCFILVRHHLTRTLIKYQSTCNSVFHWLEPGGNHSAERQTCDVSVKPHCFPLDTRRSLPGLTLLPLTSQICFSVTTAPTHWHEGLGITLSCAYAVKKKNAKQKRHSKNIYRVRHSIVT